LKEKEKHLEEVQNLENKYSDLQEEIENMTEKLSKMEKKYQSAVKEIKDI